MQTESVSVRSVAGRYPSAPAVLRSENIEATITEVARVYQIRLDDAENPDMWLEITVEIES
jgi:hypothetical protein